MAIRRRQHRPVDGVRVHGLRRPGAAAALVQRLLPPKTAAVPFRSGERATGAAAQTGLDADAVVRHLF